jgi:CubicO group peptidase (beta-lactamase class C family)
VHTHAHVVDILSRQQSLNFTPGTRYSYSNSGYNLAAVIVSRVSGMSFAEFSRERIFEPLGMTSTSWRDDYTRLVPGRAVAYSGGRGGGPGRGARGGGAAGRGGQTFRINMPYENVHGNGGLLTTVGDLLRWNENFVTPTLGDEAFVRQQQTVGRFSDGQAHTYAFGLRMQPYKGLPEVSHSGSTAGYRAFLTRYPDQHLSVAVLCNVTTANPTALAHSVADLYLGDALVPDAPRAAPLPATQGPRVGLERDDAYQPSADDLADFVGTYTSDEIETAVTVAVENGQLVIERRPDRTLVLRPFSQDRFDAPQFGLVTFHRRGGRVTEFGVTQDRVWDLRFIRAAPGR